MRIISWAACLVFIISAGARAQTLTDRVPGDAIAYVGWKGAASPDNGYAGSHLQAIIDTSGFAALRDQVIPQLMKKITENSNDHGEGALVAKTTLNILWKHPSAAFFAGMTADANGKPVPRLGVICQAGTDSDALMTIFNAAVQQADPPQSARALVSGDCTALLIGYSGDDALPAAGDTTKSLSASADFQRVIAQTGKDGVITAYLDAERALLQIDAAVAANGDDDAKVMWPRARDASGIAGLKHIALGAGFDGQDWQDQCFIDAPAPRSGLLKALEPTAIDPSLLARIPATADVAMFGQVNINQIISQGRAIAAAANPTAGDMFDKGMAVIQMAIGRNLQRDILGPLGSQWAIYSDASIPVPKVTPPADGTPIPPIFRQPGPNMVVVNKLADADRAQEGWTMLSYAISNSTGGFIRARHLPISMTTSQNGTDDIYTIVTPYMQPSWTIKDGFMYFGFCPEAVIAAANRASGDLITAQAGFAALAKTLQPSGAFNGFEYTNLPVYVSSHYAQMQQGIDQLRQLAQEQGITLPEQILPPLDKLLPELSPQLTISWTDDAGWHKRGRGPVPELSSSGGVAGVAVGTAILLPALNRARETANRVKCASNERQIGQAILLYANDHQGSYPADLGDLLKDEDLTAAVFLCPSSNTSLPANMAQADLAAWVKDHGDYVYVGAGLTNATAGATDVVVYEKPGDHKEGMNILYGDGHVEFDRMAAAVKLIQDQHKTVPGVPLP
jgi:prepilin-type processing-associated H-X9-DG protein